MSYQRDTWRYQSGYNARRPTRPDPRMRISDAERKEVTDTLSRHYADGRLDTTEFDERVGKVIAAKTRGDLAGILDDLPPLDSPEPPPRRRRPPVLRIALAFLLLASAAAMVAASAHAHVPWILLAVVAWIVWHRSGHRYRRARWR
jgi:hypothetical protein